MTGSPVIKEKQTSEKRKKTRKKYYHAHIQGLIISREHFSYPVQFQFLPNPDNDSGTHNCSHFCSNLDIKLTRSQSQTNLLWTQLDRLLLVEWWGQRITLDNVYIVLRGDDFFLLAASLYQLSPGVTACCFLLTWFGKILYKENEKRKDVKEMFILGSLGSASAYSILFLLLLPCIRFEQVTVCSKFSRKILN